MANEIVGRAEGKCRQEMDHQLGKGEGGKLGRVWVQKTTGEQQKEECQREVVTKMEQLDEQGLENRAKSII
jgi:hypothetical protein